MTKEILINSSPAECRVALVEDRVLQEVLIERRHAEPLVGNIYKGTVQRVIRGMQSAFVSIEAHQDAFLHVTDIAIGLDTSQKTDSLDSRIEESIRQGEQMLFQVTKEPTDSKAARVSTHITLASRYLVMTPRSTQVRVSLKIEDENERERLKQLIAICQGAGTAGFIARTTAAGAELEVLQRDADLLKARWQDILRGFRLEATETLLYRELSVPLKVLRDLGSDNLTTITVDDDLTLVEVQAFLKEFLPGQLACLARAEAGQNLFDRYGLEQQIQAALEPRVALSSGGYLVIEQTEAMTTIDVNTGSYLGNRQLAETVLQTNLEAAKVIPKQLRLRSVGGIVVVDFIDMKTEADKQEILDCLQVGLSQDPISCRLLPVSALGLVEITRKRSGKSLQMLLAQPCLHCHGLGYVNSTDALAAAVLREVCLRKHEFENSGCLILAGQELVDWLKTRYHKEVQGITRDHAVIITFKASLDLCADEYRLIQPEEVQ
jgi:ribonuclease G